MSGLNLNDVLVWFRNIKWWVTMKAYESIDGVRESFEYSPTTGEVVSRTLSFRSKLWHRPVTLVAYPKGGRDHGWIEIDGTVVDVDTNTVMLMFRDHQNWLQRV